FGAGVVLLLFFLLIWHGIKICIYAPNRFTSIVAAGLVGQVAIQVVLNVAVNTNTIPATGISLPFISYGGSSLLFLMASMGILLNISQYTRRNSAG
ncbi:MAG: FtsW/RodA/SpoVE family cell cycle protein, partial [Clostridia bacterium]